MKRRGGGERCEEERNERMKKNKWFCLLDVTDVVLRDDIVRYHRSDGCN